MRKHDLFTAISILLAGAAAGLYYYSDYPLAGQIIFGLVALAACLHPKFLSAPFQLYWAFVMCVLLGGISGDWWLSFATTLAFFSMNLRLFIFRDGLYSRFLLMDPGLSVMSVLVYIGVNLFHHNGWQGWVLPLTAIISGIMVFVFTYSDRVKVRELMAMGVIEAGTIAPDFTLTNYNGEKISLSDYKDKRDVLLIFVRGDWCPGCHIMLRLYERERKKFQDKNVMLFAIGPDPVGVNLAMVKKLGVEFAVLSDETMEVSKKFCVRIQEDVPGTKYDPGIPLPASFLVDKKGIIRYTSRADRAGEFLRPDIIFEVLEKLES